MIGRDVSCNLALLCYLDYFSASVSILCYSQMLLFKCNLLCSLFQFTLVNQCHLYILLFLIAVVCLCYLFICLFLYIRMYSFSMLSAELSSLLLLVVALQMVLSIPTNHRYGCHSCLQWGHVLSIFVPSRASILLAFVDYKCFNLSFQRLRRQLVPLYSLVAVTFLHVSHFRYSHLLNCC